MENTAENNRVIADFMGWVHHKEEEYDKKEMDSLKYSTSWDWLMPVVEKIESFGYTFSIHEKEAYTCHNKNDTNGDFSSVTKSKIESAYNVAIAFINWYNA